MTPSLNIIYLYYIKKENIWRILDFLEEPPDTNFLMTMTKLFLCPTSVAHLHNVAIGTSQKKLKKSIYAF